jgi:predicted nucleic acid-binding protein
MITAVDTNILLDVLIPGQTFADSSKDLLDHYLSKGRLILCEVVFSELAACFADPEEFRRFLFETGMELVYSSENALFTAGSRWADYAQKGPGNRFSCRKCGHIAEISCPQCEASMTRRLHVLADFQIGAHALVHADGLLSRDLGIYKRYFSDLRVVCSA